MDLQPGDFVECLDDSPAQFGGARLERGRIYSVSATLAPGAIHPDHPRFEAPEAIIDLTEAPRPLRNLDGWIAYGWRACRFRKVYRPDPDLIARLLSDEIAL